MRVRFEGSDQATFTPIATRRVFEMVLEQLKDLIRAGKLRPGDRLPPERELASMLRVSRNSLREGLRLLEALGAVESKTGEGTVFRQPRLDQVFLFLGAFLFLDDTTYRESYEVRILLETETARLAAERGTEEQLEELGQLRHVLESSADVETLTDADYRFHYLIARMSGNSLLVKVWEFFSGLIGDSMLRFRRHAFADPAALASLATQHVAIHEAIARRDPEAARRAMHEHLTFARQMVEKTGLREL